MHLPQEYWREKTLFEIGSGIDTPLIIDDAARARLFGLYARVLVDVDMLGQLFDSVIVETEGYAFSVSVQYERQPPFGSYFKFLGHTIQQCKKIGAAHVAEGLDLGWNKPHVAKQVHHKQIVHNVPEAHLLNKHTHSQATNKIYPNTLS